MHQNDITAEVAILDGWTGIEFGDWIGNPYGYSPESGNRVQLPDYSVSRDAVIPVIEKIIVVDELLCERFLDAMKVEVEGPKMDGFSDIQGMVYILILPARQLCIALLKATGKWRDQ